uniref:E3 ubiquitin-protein ligase RNF220-like isoform X2 n=1 Tax=Ciona intestinalis TaxID=7719 RepID=UPI00089DAA28|nr:E3 ubiquitin-protein ligase RNF220-like isoform X2 [Ciona intestinalis]|eukprot:XP_018668622.1 E3 ubiquitin-protein ligase RNF220-like isoform X2 [Ciona intestinalis]
MSGADKFPYSRQFHGDFRYFGHSSSRHPQPPVPAPSAAATVPPPAHPFIAHFYPMLAGTECPNPGYPSAINPTPHQTSAAALVALAGQNFSSQLLQNFQLKAFREQLSVKEDAENQAASSKPIRQQFDVESLTGKSPTQDLPSNQLTLQGASATPDVFPSPLHAWQQLLRRFRGNESPPDPIADPYPSYIKGSYQHHPPNQHREIQRNFAGPPDSLFRRDSMEMPPSYDQLKRKRPGVHLSRSVAKSPRSAHPERHNDINPVDFSRRSPTSTLNETATNALRISNSNNTLNDHVDILTSSPTGSSPSREHQDYDTMLLTNRNTSSVSSNQSQDDVPRRRKKRSSSVSDLCPVCGLTVRESELTAHVQMEIEKLAKLPNDIRKKAFCHRKSSFERKPSFTSSSSCNATSTSSKRLTERDSSPKSERDNREKTFRKVRSNRVDRLNSRVGNCLKAQRSTGETSNENRVWIGHSGATMCPVCSTAMHGSSAEMSAHVEQCIRQRQQSRHPHDEEEEVDVENDPPRAPSNHDDTRSNQSFSSDCDWRNETRSNVPRVPGSNLQDGSFPLNRTSQQSEQVLNVETDDTYLFGLPQFSEADVTSCSVTSHEATRSATESPDDSVCSTPPSTGHEESCSNDVASLHLKIKKLINDKRSNRCQICMDSYEDPLASIECWHVHCRKCWLRALSVKKLCPQCSAITPADKLRRVYL